MLAVALPDLVPEIKEYELAALQQRQQIQPALADDRSKSEESTGVKEVAELAVLADRVVKGLKRLEAGLASNDIEDLECLIEQARSQIQISSESNAFFGERLRELSRMASAARGKAAHLSYKVRRLTDRVKKLRTSNARVLSAYRISLKTLQNTLSIRQASYAESWQAYLEGLGGHSSAVTAELAALVMAFWSFASSHAVAPDAAPTDDGFLLVWNKAATKQLQVEIFPDARYDWFYRDHAVKGYESGEGIQVGVYSHDLIEHLRKFS